jgi:hypothetical protein
MSATDETTSQPFPFVVGCDRSGTTLLRALLDSHPHLAVPSESYFPLPLLRRQAEFKRAAGVDSGAVIDFLATRERWRQWAIPEQVARDYLAEANPSDMPALVRALFALYADQQGKDRYGDKTPHFLFAIDELAAALPEAVFIHLVRDGRDVALSRRDAGWRLKGIDLEALRWETHVRYGRDHGRALGRGRYLEIRYEDLVDDTTGTMQQVCAFIRVAWDPAMLSYHERASDIVSTAKQPGLHTNIAKPPTKGLRDWTTQLEPADIRMFDAVAGSTLEAFGYRRGDEKVRPVDRVHAEWARLRWRLSGERKVTRI